MFFQACLQSAHKFKIAHHCMYIYDYADGASQCCISEYILNLDYANTSLRVTLLTYFLLHALKNFLQILLKVKPLYINL